MKNFLSWDDYFSNKRQVKESIFRGGNSGLGELRTYKRPNIIDKLKSGTKNYLGIEDKKDRETFDRLISNLQNPAYPDFVSNIRDLTGSDGIKAAVADTLSGNLLVRCDSDDPIISFRGKKLDLVQLDIECDYLYNILMILSKELS
jgi:hypothetical protein